MKNLVQLVLLVLAAICFAFAYFDKTLEGHSLLAAGAFLWVLVPIINHVWLTTIRDPRVP